MSAISTDVKPGKAKQESLDSFKEHADTIREDVKHLREDTAAAATDAVQAISETAKHSAETVAGISKGTAEKAGEYHDAMCSTVRKHPTAAVLTALAAGVVVGKFIGR